MKISQDQLREAAQILFPQQWKTDRAAALLGALKVFEEASFDFERRPAATKSKKNDQRKRPQEIVDLEQHLKNNEIHVTAAAKAIGVHAVSLYSWFHGNAEPKAANLAKIRNFLSKTRA